VRIRLGQEINVPARSNALRVNGAELHIISIGRGVVSLDNESRLTAKLHTAILQYAKIDYWISGAVFDEKGALLGAASYKQSVERIRLGKPPTMLTDTILDFGISTAYARAALIAVTVSERAIAPAD